MLGIQASRLPAAKQDAIILQREAVPALYRAFHQAFAPQAPSQPAYTPEVPPLPAPHIAPPEPLEVRAANLETARRDEAAKREAIEAMLHNEVMKRAALARRLARTEALLAAAIGRLIQPEVRLELLPEAQPPRRRRGRPRRKKWAPEDRSSKLISPASLPTQAR